MIGDPLHFRSPFLGPSAALSLLLPLFDLLSTAVRRKRVNFHLYFLYYMEGNLDRRGFLKKAAGGAAAIALGTEATAQGSESLERVTLSRLEFNALHFGITPNQLQKLQAGGATFQGNDIAMDIRLYGKRLALSSVDKVIRIVHGAGVTFTVANDKEIRRVLFEKQ